MEGDKFAGIDIKWDYANRRCRICMKGYIEDLLLKFKHLKPPKRRLLPYACTPIAYGAKSQQLSPEADNSELLDAPRKPTPLMAMPDPILSTWWSPLTSLRLPSIWLVRFAMQYTA